MALRNPRESGISFLEKGRVISCWICVLLLKWMVTEYLVWNWISLVLVFEIAQYLVLT